MKPRAGALGGAVAIAFGLVACQSAPPSVSPALPASTFQAAVPPTPDDTRRLAACLRGLGPQVSPAEAGTAAAVILETTEQARRIHRFVHPASWHNVLVRLRVKRWGLCWHWTERLGQVLSVRHFKTLDLHWACAHEHSLLHEHNSLVLTARGRPFADGLVIDPWRASGQLTWVRVADDTYPWQHDARAEGRWRPVPGTLRNTTVPGRGGGPHGHGPGVSTFQQSPSQRDGRP